MIGMSHTRGATKVQSGPKRYECNKIYMCVRVCIAIYLENIQSSSGIIVYCHIFHTAAIIY